MKRFTAVVFCMIGLFLLGMNSQVFANSASIYLNGSQLSAANLSQVEIVNNKVMVPIRVVEELGYAVNWNKAEKTVKIQNKSKTITMTANKSNAQVDDRVVKLPSPLLLKNNTSFVPLRFMSEEFGLKVNWDNRSKTVYLTSDTAEDSSDLLIPQEEGTPGAGAAEGAGTGANTGTSTSPGKGTDTGTGTSKSPGSGTGTGAGSNAASTHGNRKIEDIHFTDNRLTITMDQTVQPKAFAMSGPDRIVIDLPGAALSEAFIGKHMEEAGIGQIEVKEEDSLAGKIRYSLFDAKSSTIRMVLDLNTQADYRLSTGDSIIVLELAPKTASGPIDSDHSRRLVVIDAGHGDHDNGTTGVSGRVEKDFNLTMALKVEELLRQEPLIEVVLTRYDDTYVTRPDRAKLANDLNADAFISIHANSVLNIPTANGTETYYYSEASKPLADIMHKHLVQATQLKDRKVKYNNYEVLRRSNMPATLLEVGFLSNAEEEALLFTEDFQNRVAQGIVDAIKEYFGIVS